MEIDLRRRTDGGIHQSTRQHGSPNFLSSGRAISIQIKKSKECRGDFHRTPSLPDTWQHRLVRQPTYRSPLTTLRTWSRYPRAGNTIGVASQGYPTTYVLRQRCLSTPKNNKHTPRTTSIKQKRKRNSHHVQPGASIKGPNRSRQQTARSIATSLESLHTSWSPSLGTKRKKNIDHHKRVTGCEGLGLNKAEPEEPARPVLKHPRKHQEQAK